MVATPPRWVARPVEIEAVVWTGHFIDLPPAWQTHPLIRWNGDDLAVTTIEGFVGAPEVGDYLVWGTASELYWAPPAIFEARWKYLAGIRWIALPVETEAAVWTGRFTDLPDTWQDDPHLEVDRQGLALTTHRGVVTRPRIGDYIVPRTAGKWSWVPRAIFEYKYERTAS